MKQRFRYREKQIFLFEFKEEKLFKVLFLSELKVYEISNQIKTITCLSIQVFLYSCYCVSVLRNDASN